jgi:hypothetical protein
MKAPTMKSTRMRFLGGFDLVIGYGIVFVAFPIYWLLEVVAMEPKFAKEPVFVWGLSFGIQFIGWIGVLGGLILSGHMLWNGLGQRLAWTVGLVSLLKGMCELGLGAAGVLHETYFFLATYEILLGTFQLLIFLFALQGKTVTH